MRCPVFIKHLIQYLQVVDIRETGCWLRPLQASRQDPLFRLTSKIHHISLGITENCLTPPLRSTSITEASALLRTAPPQCAASVLKPLWVRHLGASLNIRTTGSRISIGKPSTESYLLYAGHRLHSIRNSPAGLSLRRNRPQLSMSKENFTTPQRRFGFTHLSVQHLTNHCSPFPQRSRPSLLMTAA